MPVQPKDHQPAADADRFTFEHDGKTYTFAEPLAKVRRPGWLRANRRRDELDLAFTIIEEVAGQECLEVIDGMGEDEFQTLCERINEAMTGSLGNSAGPSPA